MNLSSLGRTLFGSKMPKSGFLTGAAAERMKHAHQNMFSRNLERVGARLSPTEDSRIVRPNAPLGGTADEQAGYIWDTLTVAANTAMPAKTTMFTSPISGNTKGRAGTNLTQPGQLAAGNAIDIYAIRLYFLNNITPTDLLAVFTNVSIQVHLNNFTKWEGLAWMAPAGGGLWVQGNQVGTAPAGSSVLFSASNGVPDIQNVFALKVPINLGPLEPFDVTIVAESAFTTQANTTNPAGTGLTLVVALEGQRTIPYGG